ncbi:MAG: YtxH domain-containing protein [Blastocatellia bacterium]
MINIKNFEFSKLNSFLIGIGVGATIALMFAPKSGKDLRGDISDSAHHGVDLANNGMKQVKNRATNLYKAGCDKTIDIINSSKKILDKHLDKQKDIVSNAVNAGKKAYLDSKTSNDNTHNAQSIEG